MRLGFGLSLLLHFLVFVVLAFLGLKSAHEASLLETSHPQGAPKSLQVRSVTEKELKKELKDALESENKGIQVVQTDDRLATKEAPETNEKVYWSKTNQKADRNTRAARVGQFKNVLKEALEGEKATASDKGDKTDNSKTVAKDVKDLFKLAPSAVDLEQQKSTQTNTGRLKIANEQTNRKPAGDNGEGFSASDDFISDDIAIGANTLLNAKEFTFYSFFERIREKLTHQWHAQLDQEVGKLASTGQGVNGTRTTKLEVSLDSRGEVQTIRVVGSSGLEELDRAATNAFKHASPFPNPPTEMLEGGSRIVSIKWDFVVLGDQTSGIKVQVKRAPAAGRLR